MKDVSALDELIKGRVDPYIYAFTTNTLPNYLKVGETFRGVSTRLLEWKRVYPDLSEKFNSIAKVDEEVFFRDYSVHSFLQNDLKKQRLQKNEISENTYYSNEFFKDVDVKDVENAINDINNGYKQNNNKYTFYNSENRLPETYHYRRNGMWTPRPNQQKVIDNFSNAVKSGRTNLLMYAVMRFGKSFTAMCCAKEIGAKVIVIVSAKADVATEWKKTIESTANFVGYEFVVSRDLENDNSLVSKILSENKGVVAFLTLQDLQGSEIKEKHHQIFATEIDLLIIDETHFGARGKKYGEVLQDKRIDKDISEKGEDEFIPLEDATNQIKYLESKVQLHLSGTPYRILMGSEFEPEDIIAFYQFSDIVQDQYAWDNQYLVQENYREWDNPYYGFPQMIRFAFQPNESAMKKLNELEKNGSSYAFSKLFKPKSIRKTKNGDHTIFENEQEILDLLQVIDGSKSDNKLFSFLNYDKIKDGKMCRHMVLVLPYCASCDALEELIKNNNSSFINLNEYEVINISGVDSHKKYPTVESVKNRIKECESNNKKTITLTVNRMLTGSTIEQWDTMLYFKDTASPQEYDQSIFRIQNQYVKTYRDEKGNIIKLNMKPQTLLVDFDPNRMFFMQELKSQIYNVNTNESGNNELSQRISEELEISPIIVLNKDRMVEVTANDILKIVSEYSRNKSVVDEAMDIPVDLSLLDITKISNVIRAQGEMGSKQGLLLNPHEGEETDIDIPNSDIKERASTFVGEKNKADKEEVEKEKEFNPVKQFQTYYTRILFFSFLTNCKISSMDDIINYIDEIDNNRIAKNLDISKDVLILIRENIDMFILSKLDYKIQNINNLANDESIPKQQRALTAINKFDRYSSSEIRTPNFICDHMLNFFTNDYLINLLETNKHILDLAGKSGEFALATYNRYTKEIGYMPEDIKNIIFTIPTSSVAYEFTRKIYSFLDLNVKNIAQNFTSYDLLSQEDKGANINRLLSQNKDFCDIKLEDTIKETAEVDVIKFDAIVGNPPYQENIGSNQNKSLGKQLYPGFIKMAINMEPQYLSMITPSRWFTANAQDRSFTNLRKFIKNKNHFKTIVNYLDPKQVFPDVMISGGVNYFLYEKDYSGLANFKEVSEQGISEVSRPLFEDDLDIILPMNSMINILRKVKSENFHSIDTITTGRNPFGVPPTDSKLNKVVVKNEDDDHQVLIRCAYENLVYISADEVTRNIELMDKWKVFTSKMNGGAGTLLDDSPSAILGKTYIAPPSSVCSNALISLGGFDTEIEAVNLNKYMNTKFFRFMLGIKKVSQVLTRNVYEFAPLQDFTEDSDIEWHTDLNEIDKQLFSKYKLSEKEIEYINQKIKDSLSY